MKQHTVNRSHWRWLLAAGTLLCLVLMCGCKMDCLHFQITKEVFVADCDSAGYTLHRCEDCGMEYRTDVTEPCGHELTREVTPPTCTAEGYTTYACKHCDYTYRAEAVAPLAHELTREVTPPTCQSEGYTTYTCKHCDYTYRAEAVALLPHDLGQTLTLPTCTTEGHTTYACRACDYTYRAELVPPLEHELTEKVTPPTCTEAGYTTLTCRRCLLSYVKDITSAPAHDYEGTPVVASCDAAGYTEYVCCVCGDSYRDDYTAPTGHRFEKELFGPTTCVTTGYTRYTCADCEVSYIGDFVFYSDVFEGAYGASDTPLANGVDISKYNHPVDPNGNYLALDFAAIAAAGYDFVILKIGSTPRVGADGVARGGIEPTFEDDYAAARAAGLDIGVYFYTYSTTPEGAAADAALVLEWLGERTLEYPIYFDIEDDAIAALGRNAATELCLSFLSTLQARRYFGALYTNNTWLTTLLQTDKVTFLFDIWYARYPGGEGPFVWNTEKYGPGVGMWQYTPSGKIEGLPAQLSFDLNYAYKDYPTIIRTLGYNGYPPPATEET